MPNGLENANKLACFIRTMSSRMFNKEQILFFLVSICYDGYFVLVAFGLVNALASLILYGGLGSVMVNATFVSLPYRGVLLTVAGNN